MLRKSGIEFDERDLDRYLSEPTGAGTPTGVHRHGPVRLPVVSLRSTTGYKLASLRDETKGQTR
jgi:ribosomal protein S10